MHEEEISHLWIEYVERRDDDSREKIIKIYANFTRMLAAKLYAKRQIQEIEFDDYLHYAFVGLIESVDRFDPTKKVSFQAYASARINGAVLSGIEKNCERQQQIALRVRLRKERLRSVEGDNVSKGVNLSLFEKLAEVAVGLAVGFMLEDTSMYRGEEPKVVQAGYERIEFLQLCDVVRRLVDLLPEQQKKVVKYHYHYFHNFDEIGGLLGVSKGRVSQIHKQALLELRALCRQYGELDRSI